MGIKFKINKGKLLGYIVTVAFCLIYMFLFDSRYIISLILVLSLAPFISFFMLLKSTNAIDISVKISSDMIYKNENVELSVFIESLSFIPIPFVYIKMMNPSRLVSDAHNEYVTYTSKGIGGVVSKNYTSYVFGREVLGIEEIAILDYLGLFRLTLLLDEKIFLDTKKDVYICPNIVELTIDEFLDHISNKLIMEDSENEQQSINQNLLTVPGYEHRQYILGDQLKRVNWKLSAKTRELMVREFEFIGSYYIKVFLDCKSTKKMQEDKLIIEERIIEALLSSLNVMIDFNINFSVYVLFDRKWQEFAIKTKHDIYLLQLAFCKYEFLYEHIDCRIPIPDVNANSCMIIFTCEFDEDLYSEVCKNQDTDFFVIASNRSKLVMNNLWYVNEEYKFLPRYE